MAADIVDVDTPSEVVHLAVSTRECRKGASTAAVDSPIHVPSRRVISHRRVVALAQYFCNRAFFNTGTIRHI